MSCAAAATNSLISGTVELSLLENGVAPFPFELPLPLRILRAGRTQPGEVIPTEI